MAKRLATLVCLIGVPSLAAAQTMTVTESNDQDSIINQAECNNTIVNNLAFAWQLTTQQTVDLYVSDTASCPQASNNTNSNAHTKVVSTAIVNQTFNPGITAASLIASVGLSCAGGSSSSLFFCVFPTGTNTTPVATTSIQLDLATPPPPENVQVAPGDSALNLSWSPGSGAADAGQAGSANSYDLYYAPSDAGIDVTQITSPGVKQVRLGSNTTSGRINNLVNGTSYDVVVTALSIGSNESGPSTKVTGTPVPVNDFWRLYKNDGGRETGGCAAGAAGMLALLAVPLALRAWRKRQ